jgi:hypothetical protein
MGEGKDRRGEWEKGKIKGEKGDDRDGGQREGIPDRAGPSR